MLDTFFLGINHDVVEKGDYSLPWYKQVNLGIHGIEAFWREGFPMFPGCRGHSGKHTSQTLLHRQKVPTELCKLVGGHSSAANEEYNEKGMPEYMFVADSLAHGAQPTKEMLRHQEVKEQLIEHDSALKAELGEIRAAVSEEKLTTMVASVVQNVLGPVLSQLQANPVLHGPDLSQAEPPPRQSSRSLMDPDIILRHPRPELTAWQVPMSPLSQGWAHPNQQWHASPYSEPWCASPAQQQQQSQVWMTVTQQQHKVALAQQQQLLSAQQAFLHQQQQASMQQMPPPVPQQPVVSQQQQRPVVSQQQQQVPFSPSAPQQALSPEMAAAVRARVAAKREAAKAKKSTAKTVWVGKSHSTNSSPSSSVAPASTPSTPAPPRDVSLCAAGMCGDCVKKNPEWHASLRSFLHAPC